jgi:hypothetical protein
MINVRRRTRRPAGPFVNWRRLVPVGPAAATLVPRIPIAHERTHSACPAAADASKKEARS